MKETEKIKNKDMNYDFIKRKNFQEYNSIPEFDIISENSSINSNKSETDSDNNTKIKNNFDNNTEVYNKIKELMDFKFIDFRKKIIVKKKVIW